MRAVAVVDPSTTILGIPTPLPVFVSPAAMAGLGHPEGECNITRGAGAMGIIQGVSLLPRRPFVGLTRKFIRCQEVPREASKISQRHDGRGKLCFTRCVYQVLAPRASSKESRLYRFISTGTARKRKRLSETLIIWGSRPSSSLWMRRCWVNESKICGMHCQ